MSYRQVFTFFSRITQELTCIIDLFDYNDEHVMIALRLRILQEAIMRHFFKPTILLLLFLLLPTMTPAQPYPTAEDSYINDYAGIISEHDQASIREQLQSIRKDHGVEITVLTIDSRKTYDNSTSIESFATGLFNSWGIGDAQRNDGILILIARNDREMRIELGRGYSAAYNAVAAGIIDQHILPSFKYNKYSKGIRIGSAEVVRRIALPMVEGQDAPTSSGAKSDRIITFGVISVIFAALVLSLRRIIGDLATRFRNCPNCGRKGLRRLREVLQSASHSAAGSGITRTTCTHCDYRREQHYSIPRRSQSRSSSGGSFGGGSSSGGGASGRW